MKNVTISVPEDQLRAIREYAQEKGTTLNDMLRQYIKECIGAETQSASQKLLELGDEIQINKSEWTWNRDEIYDR